MLFLAQSPSSQDVGIKGPNPFSGFSALQDGKITEPRPQKFVEKEPETKVHGPHSFFPHGKLTINLRPNKDFVFFSDASLFYCDTAAPPLSPSPQPPPPQSSSIQTVPTGRKTINQHWEQCDESPLLLVHHSSRQWPAECILGSRWSTKPTGNPLRGF